MRRPSRRVAGWVMVPALLACATAPDAAGDGPPRPAGRPDVAGPPAGPAVADKAAESPRRVDLDPGSPLRTRIRAATPHTLEQLERLRLAGASPIQDRGVPTRPTPHELTDAERARFESALGALLPRHRRVLQDRLRGFAFLDGMPVSGIVTEAHFDPIEPQQTLYDVTISSDVLLRDASGWLTWKERGCFRPTGGLVPSIEIDVGSDLDALTYVLLHEATHVVECWDQWAAVLAPRPAHLRRPLVFGRAEGAAAPDPYLGQFGEGVWNRNGPAPAYRDPLREQVRYYQPAHALPPDRAPEIYEGLRRTPFASLYSAQNPSEDLAEFVTLHHCTAVLGHPYRITVRRGDAETLTLEPMKSDLVRGRAGRIRRFYDTDPPPGP